MVEGGTLDPTVLCCCFCDPGLAFLRWGHRLAEGRSWLLKVERRLGSHVALLCDLAWGDASWRETWTLAKLGLLLRSP